MRRKNEPEAYVELALKGLSNYKIAEQLGVHEKTVRKNLDMAGFDRSTRFSLDATKHIVLDAPVEIIGEAIITADWHFPLFSPSMGNQVLDAADETGIKTLVIAGDLFNMDALSRFEPKQESTDLWEEIQVGLMSARILLQTFDKIYYVKGNHDWRMVRSLGFRLKFNHAMSMVFGALGDDLLEKIVFSNLDHLWVRPWEGAPSEYSWYVCHPEAYTQVPLSKGRLLADKFDANIISAHSHHFAQGWARDGKTLVAEAGGLFDASKTEYLQTSTSYPVWQNGFMWLQYDGTLLGLRSPTNLWVPRS